MIKEGKDVLNKYGDYQAYSFNIFDTILTRITGSPEGIFTIMQQRIQNDVSFASLPQSLSCDFARIRRNYEDYSRKHLPENRGEITLEDIYIEIAQNYALTEAQIETLKTLELEIEYNYSIALTDTIEEIKVLVSIGKKVLLISDIYLPYSAVKKMLNKADMMFARLPTYLSSECQKTKSEGTLFTFVQGKEHLTLSSWIHIGDNKFSDYKIPKSLGLQAFHKQLVKETFFEKYLDKELKYNVNAQVFLGSSKVARLYDKQSFMYRVGCNYAGPILTAFACWILEQCKLRCIDTIYFIARDGYIVKRIVDIIIRHCQIPIRTDYIYGSRKTWLVNWRQNDDADLLKKYLLQEIPKGSKNFAFVDSFGSGYTLDNITELMQDFWQLPITAFYIYRGTRKKGTETKNLVTKIDCMHFLDIWDNIELFCKAPEGQCLAYKEINNKVVPVCEESEGKLIQEFGFDDYLNGIVNFALSFILTEPDWKYNKSSIQDILFWYIKRINEFPDNDLLQFLLYFPRFEERKKLKYTDLGRMEREIELKLKKFKYLEKVIEKKKLFNLLK